MNNRYQGFYFHTKYPAKRKTLRHLLGIFFSFSLSGSVIWRNSCLSKDLGKENFLAQKEQLRLA